ncbi:type II toxin-antitoxin system VapC family toxin [Akkermansiaceae bacterium]|nr:type II toxin-antitoxin system VapC family toxin [Akkermansiaceae bacterium]MDA7876738.1 type II toxin-antitoxin system VapC family toxin [Akkermansiaceae bacterium]MDB4143557.1 type II toxin-antitoxin system VapC family toxin [Akkermansiaceae bacterium]MDB4294173.1 type II toxin-antitoxin system VapC family toxin [Akkermansiaceae bacterium]MDB4499337.1 type II toxin-antitoxin system VapC family toxin [Akkermansiaceae bacterium]
MIHLDTNILIALTNDDDAAEAWLASQAETEESFYVSSVTWYEFLVGPVRFHQVKDMQLVLNSAPIEFDAIHAQKAASLFNETGRARKRKTDTMIAATAILQGGRLATRNIEDFRCFEPHGLELIEV